MSKERSVRTTPLSPVTRRGAWLQQRQLRNREESLKRISQITSMLRKPSRDKEQSPKTATKKVPIPTPYTSPKTKMPKKKRQRHPKKSLTEPQKCPKKVEKSEEFHPEKLKRKIKTDKIILKPKHELKVVSRAGVQWRKRRPPRQKQELHSPRKSPSPPPSPSISELVFQEDSRSLSDEGLLEILTCESPVWWEDPPLGYSEDPIQRSQSEDTIQSMAPLQLPEIKQKDDMFMKKRSKLESLLGDIKNKANPDKIDENKTVTNEDKVNNKNKCEQTSDFLVKAEKQAFATVCKELSISTESDEMACFRDEDILQDLENMNIPIEMGDCENSNDTGIFLGEREAIDRVNKHLKTKDAIIDSIETETDAQNFNKITIESEPFLFDTKLDSTFSYAKYPAKSGRSLLITNISSSVDSFDSSSIKSENLDTISDTNIKFIDDDKSSPTNMEQREEKHGRSILKTMHKEDKPKQFFLDQKSDSNGVKKGKTCDGKKKDLMNVYKIICNDRFNDNKQKPENDTAKENKPENKNQKTEQKGKINTISGNLYLTSFYEKVRKLYERRLKTSKNQNLVKNNIGSKCEHNISESKNQCNCGTKRLSKTIELPYTKNKYCLDCSSIFDTDNCNYCIKKLYQNKSVSMQKCNKTNVIELGAPVRPVEALVET